MKSDDPLAISLLLNAETMTLVWHLHQNDEREAFKREQVVVSLLKRLDLEQIDEIDNFYVKANVLDPLTQAAFFVLSKTDLEEALRVIDFVVACEEKLLADADSFEVHSLSFNLAETLDRRALLQLRNGDRKAAMADFQRELALLQKQLEITPNSVMANEKAGRAAYSTARRYLEMEDVDLAFRFSEIALAYFDDALEIDSTRFTAIAMKSMLLSLRGELLIQQEKYEEAVEAFTLVSYVAHQGDLSLNPAPLRIAYALAKLGKVDEAVAAVDEMAVDAPPKIRFPLAQILAVCARQV